VLYEIGDSRPTTASEAVPNYSAFETGELKLTFLCVDENDPAREEKPVVWKNRISLKSRIFEQAGERFIELIAAPNAPIFYTTDGSDPRSKGASYAGAFPIPRAAALCRQLPERMISRANC
jgi:hypothetical protein